VGASKKAGIKGGKKKSARLRARCTAMAQTWVHSEELPTGPTERTVFHGTHAPWKTRSSPWESKHTEDRKKKKAEESYFGIVRRGEGGTITDRGA